MGKITVNPHIAFKIPVLRLVCEIFIAVLILALRSGSRLYKIPIADSHTKRTKVLWTGIAAAVLVELVLVLAWWIMSNGYKKVWNQRFSIRDATRCQISSLKQPMHCFMGILI